MENKKLKKNIYFLLIIILPIINLLILVACKNIREQITLNFNFSIYKHYYLPLFLIGVMTFIYSLLIIYSKKFNEYNIYKAVTFVYLVLFLLINMFNLNNVFRNKILVYKGLDVFIVINLAIYIVLFLSNRLLK